MVDTVNVCISWIAQRLVDFIRNSSCYMVSYCDQSMSGMCPVPSVINSLL